MEQEGENAPVLEEALARLVELGREFARLLDLRVEQARLGIRGALFRLLVVVWLSIALVVATGLGLSRIVAGVASLMTDWLGPPWAGDLAAGALVLVLLAAGALVVRARFRRARLRRLRRKFEARAATEASP